MQYSCILYFCIDTVILGVAFMTHIEHCICIYDLRLMLCSCTHRSGLWFTCLSQREESSPIVCQQELQQPAITFQTQKCRHVETLLDLSKVVTESRVLRGVQSIPLSSRNWIGDGGSYLFILWAGVAQSLKWLDSTGPGFSFQQGQIFSRGYHKHIGSLSHECRGHISWGKAAAAW